ncbi:GPI mannosyltransferase 2 [Diabrotica virgifera virgifera]|uniref:GPI mannosyltransferase 2 n=1 Tax=Diabrotica virgifera virgifera TaxID=50390 RepID=A0ABM5K769_DIAVI|nr:GPI mannosyltransferase 2 [Diabrotica virgifera virgifera]
MSKDDLTSIAICSRLFIVFLQFISNLIIPDHDAHVFQYLRQYSEENKFFSILNTSLSGFVRWDAEYFMHIAKYGYTFENTLAFFPVYPYIIRIVSWICRPLFYGASIDTVLLIVFIILNIVFLVLSVKVLYKLSCLFFDEKIAQRTALLFIFNPASIFFTAPYTECLFCYLTFKSIYRCTLLSRKFLKPNTVVKWSDASVLLYISLSTGVRSNGLLNIGFLIYSTLCIFFTHFPKDMTDRIKHILKYIIILSISCIVCMLPFICFQVFSYKQFCTDFSADLPKEIMTYASKNELVLPGQFSKHRQLWCFSRIPLAYSYVQDHYWNVGFLRYYEIKQIPNFLLAFPCLYVTIRNCVFHLKQNISNYKNLFNLKFISVRTPNAKDQFFQFGLTVFVAHALILAVFCTFCIHIQVSTRMICSATPLFYWYCAYYWINGKDKMIKLYFDSYFFIGTVMFCNFLPWT